MIYLQKVVLWCNGEIPSKDIINHVIKKDTVVIGVDGGADKAYLMGVEIDKVIGDLDSIEVDKWDGKLEKISDQEMSDLGKSINYLIRNKIDSVNIIGIDGGDPEHILAIWGNLAELSGKIKIRLYHELRVTERIHPDEGTLEIFMEEGEEFSIFALTPCDEFHITGSKWEMNGESLGLSSRGLHNSGLGNKVKITADGIIVIIKVR